MAEEKLKGTKQARIDKLYTDLAKLEEKLTKAHEALGDPATEAKDLEKNREAVKNLEAGIKALNRTIRESERSLLAIGNAEETKALRDQEKADDLREKASNKEWKGEAKLAVAATCILLTAGLAMPPIAIAALVIGAVGLIAKGLKDEVGSYRNEETARGLSR
ncbi:MAG: hypothetical protein QM752_03885 [Gammaproteobacteria bacterium]